MHLLVGMMLSGIFLVAHADDSNNIFVLIADVLEHQARTAPQGPVTALICSDEVGSQVNAMRLMKYMSKRNIMMSSTVSWQNFLVHLQKPNHLEETSTFVLDLSCTDSMLLLQEGSARRLFTWRKRWLVLANETLPQLDDLNIFLDSDVIFAYRTSRDQFLLEEVYRLRDKLVKKRIGIWEKDGGVTATAPLIISLRRMNLQKSVIKVVAAMLFNETLNHLQDTKDKHIDSITKQGIALFWHVSDILNASVDMVYVNTWGFSTNGTWNGLMGYLQRGEADIGATGMFMRKDRSHLVWFIHSTTSTRGAFVFRQPPLSFVESIFTLPFSRSVWLASTGLVTVIGILLYFTFRWELKEQENTNEASWSDVVLMSLGAVCQQGAAELPKSIAGRILTIMLFVATIFLYTSYAACIVALLQSSSNSIRTWKDLLQSSLKLGAFDADYNRHYFSNVSDPIRRAIYIHKICPPGGPENFFTREEGMKRVRKGLFAFYYELSSAYKIVSDTFLEEEKCGLHYIRYFPEIIAPYVGVSKKSPYKELLTIAYRRLQETGLQHREYTRFYEKKPECTGRGTSFVSVGILDCYSAFLMLAYGFLCAVLVLLIEFLAHRRVLKFKCRQVASSHFIRRKILPE